MAFYFYGGYHDEHEGEASCLRLITKSDFKMNAKISTWKARKEEKICRSQNENGADCFGSERCNNQMLHLVKTCESEAMSKA